MLSKTSPRNSRGLPLAGAILAVTTLATGYAGAQPVSDSNRMPLFLTATNGDSNYLAVINSRTKQVDYVATGGKGGASGNAGGVAVQGDLAAVVNFGSSSVTIFNRHGNTMHAAFMIPTASKPLSVAFGHGHLVVLGSTTAESFPFMGKTIASHSDGLVHLLLGDGSAAQIVTYDGGAVYTEKGGAIGLLTFGIPGLTGTSLPVTIPAAPNNDTPYGLVGRGSNVYITIAHSNLEVLVRGGKIVSMAPGVTPFKDQSGGFLHAPCWNTLSGQFLFSADSPAKQIARYLVSDSNIFFDNPSVAKLTGSPTDLDAKGGLLAVIDGGDGTTSNASLFEIDTEGELAMRFAVKIPGPINGAAIIE
jgi:hypothetical protein